MKLKVLQQIMFISKYGLIGVFLQCIFFNMILASNTLAQKSIEEIYLNLKSGDKKVEEVFTEIERNTDFTFSYRRSIVRGKKIEDQWEGSQSLGDVLRKLSKGTDLQFKRIGDNIFVKKKEFDPGNAQSVVIEEQESIEVSGKVTDENGEGLPGVSIRVKGGSVGTTTNFKGDYTINVDENDVLVFSYVGYTTQEVPISGQKRIDVNLQPDVAQLDAITVTGFRASQQRAIAIKRQSSQFVDAISAEDAGKLPDRNVAEALQRVSGVAIQRTRGQGDFISIRGLGPEFARGSINGRTLVSATESFNPVVSGGIGSSTGRATNFDVLPSELIESIEVFKTNAAEHVEGGLAGTVNINTSKPLKTGNKFGANVRAVNYGFAEELSPSLSGFGSWANDAKTFGVLGSVTYSKRKIREDATRTYAYFQNSSFGDPADFDTDLDGEADVFDPYFPFSASLDNFNEERERLTINGALQWGLSENTTFTLDVSHSSRDLTNLDKQAILEFPPSFGRLTVDNGYVINPDGSVQYPLGLKVDASNTAIGFGSEGYVGATVVNATDEQTSKDKIFNGGFNIEHEVGDWNLNFDASLASTTSDFAFERGSLRTGTIDAPFPTVFQVDLSAGILDVDPVVKDLSDNIINLSNASNYVTHNFDVRRTNIKDTEVAFRADAERSLGGNFLSSLKFGVRYRTRKRENEQHEFFGQLPFTEGATTLLRLNAATSGVTLTNPQENFLDGDFKGFDWSQMVFVSSPGEWRQAHIDAGGNFPIVLDPNNTYNVKESTFAGYVQANIDSKIGDIPITGNVGVRLVNTNIEIDGSAQELGEVSVPGSALMFAKFIGTPTLYNQSESYLKTLPSVNLKFEAAQDIYVRAAYSKSLTRPQFNDLAGVSINFTQNLVNKAGNPGLLPYESDNFDLGFEWYTGNGGLVGISFFYKNLSNFVTNVTRTNEEFIGNVWTSFLTRENQGEGSISGTEISFQQPFTFLPGVLKGLGLIANFTFSDGEQSLNTGQPVAFPGVSDISYNTALYYDNGGKFQARLAYTYRDKFLFLANDVFGQEQWVNDYGQLDASMSYEFIDGITVFGEAVNLGNSRNKLFSSNPTSPAFNLERPTSVEHVGQRFGFGVRAIF